MTTGEMIDQVPGLTLDKLTYYVRAGYVRPKKLKRKSLYYSDFSKQDLLLIKRAWQSISGLNMRVRAAFELASKELADAQLRIPFSDEEDPSKSGEQSSRSGTGSP
jgi:DNA-binding transcriptional MerR regulator